MAPPWAVTVARPGCPPEIKTWMPNDPWFPLPSRPGPGIRPGPRDIAAEPCERRGEGGRIAGRGTALIVVEVHVHVAVRVPGTRDPLGPRAQRGRAVPGPRVTLALVHPQVSPVSRLPQ